MIQIFPIDQQARGAFDGGAILENKPVGFPQEGGKLHAFSNLFYWSNAWSERGGLIGEHPHKGFEILSFVLDGEIEHYDSQLKGWKRLGKGGVQIIRSRGGIAHAEKFLPGSRIFQIWFDPDLSKTIGMPASYDDYPASAFPESRDQGFVRTVYAGDGAPLEMDTPGVQIERWQMAPGTYTLPANMDQILSVYFLQGETRVDGQALCPDDFVRAFDVEQLTLEVSSAAVCFVIAVPQRVPYRTYLEMFA